MINVTELRAGVTFEEGGQPWRVLNYSHTKMGRGTANIKIKATNLVTGAIVNKTYTSGARVKPASVDRQKMQYLYSDGNKCYFMDPASFEQVGIEIKHLGGGESFLVEGMKVNVVFWQGEPLDLELPPKVKMKVIETAPGVKAIAQPIYTNRR